MIENMTAPAEAQAEGSTQAALAEPAPTADPAVAFDRMRRQLAMLSAAVEGFAARQQELHSRDYTADLAKIFDQHQRMVDAINTFDKRPAMSLTSEDIAAQVAKAGASARSADHRAIGEATGRLDNAAARIDRVVDSALTARQQRVWTAWIAGAVVPFCLLFMAFVPGMVARAAPASWYWPERMASRVLRLDGWSAGMRLLWAVDPERMRRLVNEAQAGRKDQAVIETRKRPTRSTQK